MNIVGSGEIITISASDTGKSEELVRTVMRSVFRSISDVLALNDCVRIHNFGTFIPYERPTMMGRNMQTGESVQVDARRLVRFRASKHLIEVLRAADAEIAGKS